MISRYRFVRSVVLALAASAVGCGGTPSESTSAVGAPNAASSEIRPADLPVGGSVCIPNVDPDCVGTGYDTGGGGAGGGGGGGSSCASNCSNAMSRCYQRCIALGGTNTSSVLWCDESCDGDFDQCMDACW